MKKLELDTYKQRKQFWEDLMANITSVELEKSLATLHPDTEKVLRWHYLEGYTLKEIVGLLGRSISIVRNHHNRGIFRLHNYFGKRAKNFNNAHFSGNIRADSQKPF